MPGIGRIVVPEKLFLDKSFSLEGTELSALAHWEPRCGEAFTVADLDGALFRARLLSLSGQSAKLTAFEEIGAPETGPDITLVQALPERERIELILQKATELGVTRILTFKSAKSISLEELDSRQQRSHNWGSIALKAAKQSRRPDIPEILPYSPFEAALQLTMNAGLKIMLWERPGIETLKGLLEKTQKPAGTAAMLVGPEAGFTDEEAKRAEGAGFIPVSLGQKILRTETAAIFGVGLLRYELGG
ncbi:MAG: hypothetical protein A2054_00305 [Deltaproteobacteria bacterium GWA2_55_10]|nr:MAG: hypothetical protein A2054_00305 [Deltaproteobacteria bacterium GWA2_55_10]